MYAVSGLWITQVLHFPLYIRICMPMGNFWDHAQLNFIQGLKFPGSRLTGSIVYMYIYMGVCVYILLGEFMNYLDT